MSSVAGSNPYAALAQSGSNTNDSYSDQFTGAALWVTVLSPLSAELNQAISAETDPIQVEIAACNLSTGGPKEGAKVTSLQAEYNSIVQAGQGQNTQLQKLMSSANSILSSLLGDQQSAFGEMQGLSSQSNVSGLVSQLNRTTAG